jgi:hypothetical protein
MNENSGYSSINLTNGLYSKNSRAERNESNSIAEMTPAYIAHSMNCIPIKCFVSNSPTIAEADTMHITPILVAFL